MKTQYYFASKNDEICYNKQYFLNLMDFEGWTEMEVFKAEPYKSTDTFWCRCDCFCGEDSKDSCGKQCPNYEPRNKISGCCKYYSRIMYALAEKITLEAK